MVLWTTGYTMRPAGIRGLSTGAGGGKALMKAGLGGLFLVRANLALEFSRRHGPVPVFPTCLFGRPGAPCRCHLSPGSLQC